MTLLGKQQLGGAVQVKRNVGQTVRESLLPVIIFTAIFTLGALFYVAGREEIYRSSARIKIEVPVAQTTNITANNSSSREADIDRQIEIIKSVSLAMAVIGELNLFSNLQNSGGGVPNSHISDDRLNAWYQGLTVTSSRYSQVISVQFEYKNAKLAAKAINSLIARYKAFNNEVVDAVVRPQQDFSIAENRIRKLQAEVGKIEQRLIKASGNNSVTKEVNQASLAFLHQEMGSLRLKLSESEDEVAQLRAIITFLESLDADRPGNYELALQFQRLPILELLVKQKLELEQARARALVTLLPSHPRIISMDAESAALNTQINSEGRRALLEIKKSLKLAQKRAVQTNQSIEKLQDEIERYSVVQQIENQLQASLRQKNSELQFEREKLARARALEKEPEILPINIRVLTPAIAPDKPINMPSSSIVIWVMLLTVLAGFGFALLRSIFGSQIVQVMNMADMEQILPNSMQKVFSKDNNRQEDKVETEQKNPAQQQSDFVMGEQNLFSTIVDNVTKSRQPVSATNMPMPPDDVVEVEHPPAQKPIAAIVRNMDKAIHSPSQNTENENVLVMRFDAVAEELRSREGHELTGLIGAGNDGILTGLALARAVSKHKSCLLIDFDGQNRLAAFMGLSNDKPGLAQLEYDASINFSDIIRGDSHSKAHYIVTGMRPVEANMSMEENERKLVELLALLREAYECILVHLGDLAAGDLQMALLEVSDNLVVVPTNSLEEVDTTVLLAEKLAEAGLGAIAIMPTEPHKLPPEEFAA